MELTPSRSEPLQVLLVLQAVGSGDDFGPSVLSQLNGNGTEGLRRRKQIN